MNFFFLIFSFHRHVFISGIVEEGEIGLRYNKNRYNKQILCIVIVVYIIQKQEQERTILKVMSIKNDE